MCKSLFDDQYEFLQAGDVELKTEKAVDLAIKLMSEEWQEWWAEPSFIKAGNVNDIKEVLDLIYVACQYLNVTIGPDKAKECWDALHTNNMSKCIDGKLVKRADGKVEKPEGYKKLDLTPLLKSALPL